MKINNKIFKFNDISQIIHIDENVVYTDCIFMNYTPIFDHCTFDNCAFINCIISLGEFIIENKFNNTNFYNCIIITNSTFPIDINTTTSILFYNCSIQRLNIVNSEDMLFCDCNFSGCILSDIQSYRNKISFIDCINNPKMYKNKKSFYGYKYANDYLIILEIPEYAYVHQSPSGKCRCNKAKVISILNVDGSYSGVNSCRSWYTSRFKYKVNEYIKPECKFDNRCIECTSGIHFFKNVKDAYEFAILNIW